MTTFSNNTSGIAGSTAILDRTVVLGEPVDDEQYAVMAEMAAEAQTEHEQLIAIHPDREGQSLHRFHECGCIFAADGSVIAPEDESDELSDKEYAAMAEMAMEARDDVQRLRRLHTSENQRQLHALGERHGEQFCNGKCRNRS